LQRTVGLTLEQISPRKGGSKPVTGTGFSRLGEISRLEGTDAEDGREVLINWEDEGREGIS